MMAAQSQRDPGLQAAIDAAGNISRLASRVDVTRAAISQWKRVPAERVLEIEQVTGVPRSTLRPDLYPGDRERLDS